MNTVYSTGNTMMIKLITSSVNPGKGIRMEYQAVKYQTSKYMCTPSDRFNKITNELSANIASPWYPDWYPNNMICIYCSVWLQSASDNSTATPTGF